jgi:WD40 repeat protein
VSLSSDGKYAASAEQDGGIRLWDVQTGQEVRRLGIPGRRNGAAFDPDEGGALAVAFSADGKLVAASGYSVQIHLWEADTGKHLKTLTHPAPGHGPGAAIGMVPDLAFLPDGKRLATLGPASIIAWDLTRGTAVKTIALPGIHTANKLIVPSSVRAVTGHSDGRLRVWNLDSGELLHDLGSHRGALAGLAVTRDGKRAVTGGLNGWVVVYDINGGKELKRIRDPKEPDFGFGDEDWDDDE